VKAMEVEGRLRHLMQEIGMPVHGTRIDEAHVITVKYQSGKEL